MFCLKYIINKLGNNSRFFLQELLHFCTIRCKLVFSRVHLSFSYFDTSSVLECANQGRAASPALIQCLLAVIYWSFLIICDKRLSSNLLYTVTIREKSSPPSVPSLATTLGFLFFFGSLNFKEYNKF